MAEPSTIGEMVSRVLGMASEATLQDVTCEVAKDAYKALEQKLSCRAASDVHALERDPTSAARQAVIAEVVDQLPEAEKGSVKRLATELADALRTSAAQAPVGIHVRRVEAETKLERIDVLKSAASEALVRESHYLE